MDLSFKLLSASVFLLIALIPVNSQACFTPPKHLTVHYSELVKRTSTVVLAETVKAESLPDHIDRYYFKPIEVLKGKIDKTFTMEFAHFRPAANADTDFHGHRDGIFWDKRVSRQWNGPDCQMRPYFKVGSRYLLFVDQPYHWKSFEKIVSDDDRWLNAVRKEIRTKGGEAGFSQTIYEYLKEKKAVYVDQIERCPEKSDESFFLYIKQLEHIRGERIEMPRFWPDFGNAFRQCQPGLTFLAVHNESESSYSLIHPSAFSIEDGIVDFSGIHTEIKIVGELKVPLQEIKQRLK